jgi:alcohol dehydrogenase
MSKNLVKFYNDNTEVETAAALLLATSIACMACNLIGTGDAHCIARSIGGHFTYIHHGTALAVVLPHVLDFNIEARAAKMNDLARAMELDITGLSETQSAKKFVLAIQKIRDDLGMPRSYKELNMTTDCLEELAEASKYNSENGSSAGAPPRKATIEEYKRLIMDSYEGKRIAY